MPVTSEAGAHGDVLAPLATEKGAWAREHLATDVVGWLTTQAADGRLQSSPISFLWEEGTILFYSQPDTPKLRNMAHSPKVAFTLRSDEYADHVCIVEGVASVEPETPSSVEHADYRVKHRGPLAHWGMDEEQTARDFSVPIRIRPTRIRAW
jgi:PPOX class probable F420-dependent enzyme